MILLTKLLFTGLILYFVIILFFDRFDTYPNSSDSILFKLYLFLFVFMLQFTVSVTSNLYCTEQHSLSYIVDTALSSSLCGVVAYDIHIDLIYQGFYKNYDVYQRALMLVMLIILFITTLKLLQVLFTNN